MWACVSEWEQRRKWNSIQCVACIYILSYTSNILYTIHLIHVSVNSIHPCVCVWVEYFIRRIVIVVKLKKKLISFQLNVNPENMSTVFFPVPSGTQEQQYILTAGADIYIYISLWGQRTRINRKLRWTKMVMTCRFSDLNRVSIQISTTKIQCTHRGNLVATPTDRIYFQSKPHSPNTYLWLLE